MIYVVRHGETDWNKEDKVLGRTNIPLNERGVVQAYVLANKLKEKRIDVVLSSPLDRAVETAAIIAREIGVPHKIEEVLIEQNFGIYEGMNRSDSEYQKAKRCFFMRYPEGESYLEVATRIYSFVMETESLYDNALIVTHGGICRIICSYFKDMTNDEFVSFTQGNCEVVAYRRFIGTAD